MRRNLSPLLPLLIACLMPLHPLHAEEKAAPEVKKPTYLPLDPPFVVNLQDGRKARFMQVKMQVMSYEEQTLKAIEGNGPAIRHAMIMLLAHQDGETMRSVQGREQVRMQALEELKRVLVETAGLATPAIEGVYFTDFVIQ